MRYHKVFNSWFSLIMVITLTHCVGPQMWTKKELAEKVSMQESDSITVAYLPVQVISWRDADKLELNKVSENEEIWRRWGESFQANLPVSILQPEYINSYIESKNKKYFLDDYLGTISKSTGTDIWKGGLKVTTEDIPVDDTQLIAEMLNADFIIVQWIQGLPRFTSTWGLVLSRWDYYNTSTLVTLILDRDGNRVAEMHHSAFAGFSAIKPPFSFLVSKVLNTLESNTANGIYAIADDNANELAILIGQELITGELQSSRVDAPPIPTFMRYGNGNLWVSLGTNKQWKPETCQVINSSGEILFDYKAERFPANMYGTYMLKLIADETQNFEEGKIQFIVNDEQGDETSFFLYWN